MSPHFSSSIIKHSTSRMLIVKMKTMQQLLHLLFIWLLLAAIPSHYSPISTAKDIYTGKLHVHYSVPPHTTINIFLRVRVGRVYCLFTCSVFVFLKVHFLIFYCS